MEITPISEIAHQGMQFERTRLELAALKLSLMNMSFSSQTEASNFIDQVLAGSKANELGLANNKLTVDQVSDSANPLADKNGNIYKLSVDPTHEMSTLVAATRAYEANVRAYNANGKMKQAALEIGNK